MSALEWLLRLSHVVLFVVYGGMSITYLAAAWRWFGRIAQ